MAQMGPQGGFVKCSGPPSAPCPPPIQSSGLQYQCVLLRVSVRACWSAPVLCDQEEKASAAELMCLGDEVQVKEMCQGTGGPTVRDEQSSFLLG